MGDEPNRTRLPNPEFWKTKRVLVTGHTGFKGSWLSLWLADLGAVVQGISLEPDTDPSLFQALGLDAMLASEICDIRDADALSERIEAFDPEIVLHLAAQPLVRASYNDPLATFATNVQGTANLLNALRSTQSTEAVVVVTTDKVYRNREWHRPYHEEDELGGHDPYSASKAAAELVADSFRKSFFSSENIGIATARAGNVIGGGDWALDRLLPDAMRVWNDGQDLHVRRPDATRPWQHVLEPICAYLVLAEYLHDDPQLAGAYNFGPQPDQDASVRKVIDLAAANWRACSQAPDTGSDDVEIVWAKTVAGPHEAMRLSLDPAKAARVLGVHPLWNVTQAVEKSVAWYRRFYQGASAIDLCRRDFTDFAEHVEAKSTGYQRMRKSDS